ncbi:MAG: peptidylprolyl isomerase, partial [Myxococcota bacterium]
MKRALVLLSLLFACTSAEAGDASKSPKVIIETTKGAITLELYPDKAPKTVENFLSYAKEG